LSDTSDRSSPDPFTLVLRAAFVPEGEQPPPELAADFSPLKFRATLDKATGIITCENAGVSFGGDIRAEWHPDEVQESEDGEATSHHNDAQRTGPSGGQGRNSSEGQPINRADSVGREPLWNISPTGSTPSQAQTRNTPNPGVPVRLANGQTVSDLNSPTGMLMSPVADLSPVAASGRRTGEIYRTMLSNPEAAAGAASFLGASLDAAVGQGGNFDYQRQANHSTGFTQLPQFTDVSNVNVGLFAQQAGLTLDEALRIAGTLARLGSGNARPTEPHGLDPRTAQFISTGVNLGKSGAFDKPAPP